MKTYQVTIGTYRTFVCAGNEEQALKIAIEKLSRLGLKVDLSIITPHVKCVEKCDYSDKRLEYLH